MLIKSMLNAREIAPIKIFIQTFTANAEDAVVRILSTK